ncbi:MAG: ribosome small subunit-dependent GTPase A [[Lactobacillus] timonensis]|uniref:ribosome small subunit-dependent GTPase A n=1 Tax=[Lactobacillus] timonensis TaxID=1970790 RepID=UPI000C85A870|nr:ribosome small subunit-dependent GTPase A [[Lactobacillus] timonensis]MCI1926007.1 ribosome small subunit-dependent GTPase A [[Lactobacillus] timonensis]MCI1957383.1 ribosome small subunit-dependent GTPase A [[Lactobacillus] timonensis]MCI1970481.1 ribosome small subunit-dependent GTPase A [[Lactobacillus] timonensis]MCI2006561.1 ribosome small subunit-dependent GTPase A [[Lactobacillus] timonensis]
MKKGIIQQSLGGFYDVLSDGKIFRTRARGNFRQKKIKPLVGDKVEFSADDPQHGYLLKVLPRVNSLVRPPVANVDLAVVVTAVVQPRFVPNLLDRQLVALEKNKVTPVIYFSKTDLATAEEYQQIKTVAAGYRLAGYQVFYDRNPFANEQLAQLKEVLRGQVVTMMGQTGAGKSTLLNHLDSCLQLPTGEISLALKRGRHTTRKVSLLSVGGALIADTPGFSSYEDLSIDADTLPKLFPEMLALAPQCRFRGCRHLKEPGCAVKDAVDSGTIMESRYEDYVAFQQMIANRKPKY